MVVAVIRAALHPRPRMLAPVPVVVRVVVTAVAQVAEPAAVLAVALAAAQVAVLAVAQVAEPAVAQVVVLAAVRVAAPAQPPAHW